MVNGQTPRIGMVTERTDAKIAESLTTLLDFAPLEDLVFAGWDVRFANVYEGALHHKVFPRDVLAKVRDKLESLTPWPAVFSRAYAANAEGDNVLRAHGFREELALVVRNIETFKRERGLGAYYG